MEQSVHRDLHISNQKSHAALMQWFIGIKNHKYTMRLFIQAVTLFLFLETEADIG